jgi:hypothetical protein
MKSMEHHERYLRLMDKRKEQELSRNLKDNTILEKQIISMRKASNLEELFGETRSTI